MKMIVAGGIMLMSAAMVVGSMSTHDPPFYGVVIVDHLPTMAKITPVTKQTFNEMTKPTTVLYDPSEIGAEVAMANDIADKFIARYGIKKRADHEKGLRNTGPIAAEGLSGMQIMNPCFSHDALAMSGDYAAIPSRKKEVRRGGAGTSPQLC
jgi:hypothetical protein